MNAVITCNELKRRIGQGLAVVDVMTPEDYAARHVAGAKNACIYEMAFLERIAEYFPDRDVELAVYDASGTTRAAGLARERLIGAGYANVSVLQGGLSAWCSAGLPLEIGDQAGAAETLLRDGIYRIETEKSVLEWGGRNLNNRHFGRIAIQGGELVIHGGLPVTGSIVADMSTIANLDLVDTAWRDLLIRHLKSDDFFAVERYPTAAFRLNGWQVQEAASPEVINGVASGDLTIRDITRPISFAAIVAPQVDGGIKAHAVVDINRILWDVSYGSASLFERLGMHLVHDMISLELFIQAR